MGATYISFADLSSLLGDEPAEKFCRALGGVDWRCPVNPKPGHRFEQILGQPAFALLTEKYGGQMIRTPNGRRRVCKTEIIERIQRGESNRALPLTSASGRAMLKACPGFTVKTISFRFLAPVKFQGLFLFPSPLFCSQKRKTPYYLSVGRRTRPKKAIVPIVRLHSGQAQICYL